MWGLTDSPYYKHQADVLFSLFKKYKTNIPTNTAIYRGMAIDKEILKLYGYDKIKKAIHFRQMNMQ
ncbi:MAG: hypothetical protein JJW00_04075 [Sulfurimonas sp.]|nr:hypothetical protein [Sulfurimonas sp.]